MDADLLIDQAPDAIIFAGPDGKIRRWNAAAERIFGFSKAQMDEAGMDAIIPESFRPAHWTGFERAMAAAETKYKGQALATKAQNAAGETIYVELSFAIVKDASGAAIGALAFARDITKRFTEERDMRRRLKELEAAKPA